MFESIVIVDAHGNVQDEAWLREKYGQINLRPTEPGAAFRLIELRERIGIGAVLEAMVANDNLVPFPEAGVARRWPYREGNPGLPELPEEYRTWYTHGVHDKTKDDGLIAFSVGGGDFYDPATQAGASTIWCFTYSDAVEGLGIIRSPGYPHMIPVFQLKTNGPPPPNGARKYILSAQAKLMEAYEDLNKALAELP